MKSLEDVKSYLEGLEGEDGGKCYNAVVSLIEEEKQRGVTASKKLKTDIETYRKYKTALEDAGYDGTVDATDFLSDLKDKADKSGDDGEVAKLRREFQKADKARQDFEAKYNDAVRSANSKTLKERLIAGFQDDKGNSRIYGADLLAGTLISDGKVKLIDGDVVFVDGDNETAFSDGIQHILDTRKDLVRNVQQGGAGSNGSGGKSSAKTMSTADFNKLGPKDRSQFMQDGGQLTE